jgi:hypothetical protein
VLMTSSPRNSKDRKWLTQDVGDSEAVFVVESWSREEPAIASFTYSVTRFRLLTLLSRLFIPGIDIIFGRFQEVAPICGYPVDFSCSKITRRTSGCYKH